MNNTVDDITVNDMARVASTSKKPTKAKAHKQVTEIIEKLQGHDINPEVYKGLADLYAYFMPKPPAKPKSDFDWVAKAIGKNDIRYYLNFVYVTERQIVGTDGHRLHIAPNDEGLEPGFYDSAKVKLHEPDWANYPRFERVIPSCQNRPDDYQPAQVDPEELPIGKLEGKNNCHYFDLPGGEHRIQEAAGPRVDRDYLLQALSLPINGKPVTWIGSESDTIRIDFPGERFAVVMPIRK